MRTPPAPEAERVVPVIDADPTLVADVAALLPADGRPVGFEVRTMLIGLYLLARLSKTFHLAVIPAMLAELSPAQRRRLGLASAEAEPVSYRQVKRFFSNLAVALDPSAFFGAADLTADERVARAEALQTMLNRLVAASHPAGVVHPGDYAVDATLTWAWARPPGSGKHKVVRRGRDGDGGSPLTLAEITETDETKPAPPAVPADGADFEDLVFSADPPADLVTEPAPAETAAAAPVAEPVPDLSHPGDLPPLEEPTAEPAVRRGPRASKDPDAAWVGRPNQAKSVFGWGHHFFVRARPTDGTDVPCLIECFVTTNAKAAPAPAVIPLAARLAAERAANPAIAAAIAAGRARPLGDIVADPGYSAAALTAWQLPLKALGASPVFRLHRTNQAGWRATRQGVPFVDGRPYCACLPAPLRNLDYPTWPHRKEKVDLYQSAVARREPFELEPNGRAKPNGSRRFLSPHRDGIGAGGKGGCAHCTNAITGATLPGKTRCCVKASFTFSARELGLYQPDAHGDASWYESWNRRNRVEGVNGTMKSLALTNFGHGHIRLFGIAKNSLATAFTVMAHNSMMTASWLRRVAAAEAEAAAAVLKVHRRKRRSASDLEAHLPSATPTATLSDADRALAAPTKRRRGPKGLEHLGEAGISPPSG